MSSQICACCLHSYGFKSTKVSIVTQSIESIIQNYIWRDYDLKKDLCPNIVCKSCRTNLYSIKRGQTERLGEWIEKVSQVNSNIPKYTYSS